MLTKLSFIEKMLLKFNVFPHPLMDVGAQVAAGRALMASVKLGIIDAIDGSPAGKSDVAQKANVSEHGAELVLDCLEPVGYVKKQGERYALTSTGRKFLSKDSPHSFRNVIMLGEQTYHSFTKLDHTIREGQPEAMNLDQFSEKDWEIFTKAMIELASSNLEEVVKKIPMPPKPKKLLDIGGSHGLYSIELCKRHPSLSAQVLDLEPVRPYAEKCIADYNMQGRVSFKVGDAFKEDFETGNDVILLFNIIHALSDEDNRNMLQRAFNAMNNGGILVILDQIKGIGGNSPLSRMVTSYMALNLFQQAGGRTYSFPEIRNWMKEVGFQGAQLKKLQAPGFGLVIGTK